MTSSPFTLLFSLVLVSVLASAWASDVSHGWGDSIEWHTFDDALVKASAEKKPIMLILHKSWCGACKNLKPKFAESTEISALSKSFVMVNAEDEESPHTDGRYAIDGAYIPRIFFLKSNGEPLADLYNTGGNDKYKYYYPSTDAIVVAMKAAAARF